MFVTELSHSRHGAATEWNECVSMTVYDRITLSGRKAFPRDLRDWVDERTLIGWALEAGLTERAQATFRDEDRASANALSLILFGFAIGIYGSWEIEAACAGEPGLRYLCVGRQVDGGMLRRFRRRHAALVRHSLEQLLRRAEYVSAAASGDPSRGRSVAEEAGARLSQAIQFDSMALDA